MSGLPPSIEDYGALSDAEISAIASNEGAADILRLLRDDNLKALDTSILTYFDEAEERWVLEDARVMGVLGYYLGRSTNVTYLKLAIEEEFDVDVIEPFFVGIQNNRSIQNVWLENSHIPSSDFFQLLVPFIRDNTNLETFHVHRCEMDAEQYLALSSALREGSSLKYYIIGGLGEGVTNHEQSNIENIEALKMHPHLEYLHFSDFAMGRNACAAMSDLLRQSDGMQTLSLRDNGIDDFGLEALVDGLAHCQGLQELHLHHNPSITIRGWRALAALLEDPNSSLKRLALTENDIDNESAIIFANALAHNSTLTGLRLCANGIDDDIAIMFANAVENNRTLTELYLRSNVESSGEGWKAFSRVLCDTSSVNGTFLSNHTLQHLTGPGRAPDGIASLLELNREENKQAVAVKKVLLHHDDFDMQPLFEWDLKALPFVIEWLERAAAYEIECEARTEKRKLAAIYQFVRGVPELAIGGILGVSKTSATPRRMLG